MQEIYAKTNLICQHFQPGQMSESRGEPKERTDVVDTGIFFTRPYLEF